MSNQKPAQPISRDELVRLYNDSETLAEFGEAVAMAVFGDTPEFIEEDHATISS